MLLSYLFITHNIGLVECIADRVAVMRAGTLVETGHCDDVLARLGTTTRARRSMRCGG